MENNENIALDESVNLTEIEELENTTGDYNEVIGKLDEVIFYQQHSYSVSMMILVAIICVLVFYLIYRFIINFIEF